MEHLEVIARLKVRPGELEGFKTRVAEIVRLTREKDTQTLRYDWFHNEDETEYEVHEAYAGEEGLIEHNQHVVQARDALFGACAFDHRMSVYGQISPHLADLFAKHAGGLTTFSFIGGLEQTPTV